MSAEDELIVYLQNHPEFHPLSEDARMIGVLNLLAGRGKYLTDIMAKFPGMSESDVLALLDKLNAQGYVAKLDLEHGTLFYRRESCEEFLRLYTAARGSYMLGS